MSTIAVSSIIANGERKYGLAQLAGVINIRARNGNTLNPSTLWRWARKGHRLQSGKTVCLEVVRFAGRWMSSVEAVDRFIVAQQELADNEQQEAGQAIPYRPLPRSRAGAVAAAAGII